MNQINLCEYCLNECKKPTVIGCSWYKATGRPSFYKIAKKSVLNRGSGIGEEYGQDKNRMVRLHGKSGQGALPDGLFVLLRPENV